MSVRAVNMKCSPDFSHRQTLFYVSATGSARAETSIPTGKRRFEFQHEFFDKLGRRILYPRSCHPSAAENERFFGRHSSMIWAGPFSRQLHDLEVPTPRLQLRPAMSLGMFAMAITLEQFTTRRQRGGNQPRTFQWSHSHQLTVHLQYPSSTN